MTLQLNNPESRILRFMSLHSFNTEQVVKLRMERVLSQRRRWDGSNVQKIYRILTLSTGFCLSTRWESLHESKDIREQNQKFLARNLKFILIATAHAQSMLVTQHPHIVSQFSLTNILWSDLIQVRFRILPGRVGWVECITEVASGGSTFIGSTAVSGPDTRTREWSLIRPECSGHGKAKIVFVNFWNRLPSAGKTKQQQLVQQKLYFESLVQPVDSFKMFYLGTWSEVVVMLP